jgi:predicted TIM-barrel fold metal-dependent hydrolase
MPPEDALAEMDAAGIAVAIVSQCKQWSCERQWMCVDTRLEDVTRFIQASVRFAGLCGYNPFDATESVREMEAARALGFHGTYLNLSSFGVRLSDPRLYPLFAKSAELAQPALVQVPLAEPDLCRCIERIGRDFPELPLAIACPQPARELLALCVSFDHLAYVLDTPALFWLHRQQDTPWNEVAERCMWGSNGAPVSIALQQANSLDLAYETLEAILRSNALRFFAGTSVQRLPNSLSRSVTSAER